MGSFSRHLLRRLLWLILVLFGVSLATFTISHVVPADPVRTAAGMNARPDQVEALRQKLGMDKSLPEQYITYMANLLQGDMGISIRTRAPVKDEILKYFPATIELAFVALLLAVGFGVPFGIISAIRQNSLLDHASRLISLAGISLPLFWLGLLLQWTLYGKLGLLPAQGRLETLLDPPSRITGMYIVDSLLTGNWETLKSALWHIVLPAITLSAGSMALFTRATRSSMLEVMSQNYITTARSKGLSSKVVIARHALKNALIPTVTLIGLQAGVLLSGTFLVEVIFSWPGLGFYGVRAVTFLDFPVIMGVTILISLLYVTINLVVDLSYVALDPRIKLESSR
jgi:peptide/nickel transport system permease protein